MQNFFLNEWLNHYSQIVITNNYQNLECKCLIGHLKLWVVWSQIVFPLVPQGEGATDFINLTPVRVSLSTLFSCSKEAMTTKRRWGVQRSSWRGSPRDEAERAQGLLSDRRKWSPWTWEVCVMIQDFRFIPGECDRKQLPGNQMLVTNEHTFMKVFESIFTPYKGNVNPRSCWMCPLCRWRSI